MKGTNHMQIKGAIFDMDGTLLDSMPMWRGVGVQYLKNRGCDPAEDVHEKLRNFSMEEALKFFRDEFNIEDSDEVISNGINELLATGYATAKLKEGILELLELLKAAGVKMCVATVTPRALAEIGLKSAGISEYFSKVLTCGEVGYSKATAHIFEAALEELGTTKEDTIIFEDALYAIETAKGANFRVVGIYEATSLDEQEHIEKLADFYLLTYKDWERIHGHLFE